MRTKLDSKRAQWLNKYRGSIELEPFFQRGTVWSDDKKQYFIDSIIKGWGTPKIFLWETNKDTYACLDGKQRLTSLFKFMSDDLPLKEEYSTGLGGKKYTELLVKTQDAIDNYDFAVEVISDATDDEVIELYKRLQGGTPLNFGEKIFAISGNMKLFINSRLAAKTFFKKRISLPNTRYSHYAVCAQLCLLSIKGAKEDLKLKNLEKFLKDYRSFNDKSPEANKIIDVVKYLEKAFPYDGDSTLRNRAGVVSVFYLVADLSARGDISGKEKDIGDFFRKFIKDVQKDLEKKPEDRDPSILSYQSAVTQGADKIKSINIRHSILLDRLSRRSKFFYNLIYPMSPQDKFIKIYNEAKSKLKIRTIVDFDAWLIKNKRLKDIKCPSARGKAETSIGHIRNCIHYPKEHGAVPVQDLDKAIRILETIIRK
jgi:hypothetical protein